jgi:GntR family transcriptional regulator
MNESPELVLDSGEPVRQQIEEQIRRLVLSGALWPGEELPTVRAVAVGLAISPRLVEEAYNRLARAGLVSWADGSGPHVLGPGYSPRDVELRRLCADFLQSAAERGHSLAAVLRALQAIEEELTS